MEHPKQLLDRHGLQPKQSLGQNFLFDDNILARIVETAEVGPDDPVLEIGAGAGTLTHHLARAAGRVLAVELDDRLIPLLQAEMARYEHVTVVHGDILHLELDLWFGDGAYKVVANVPYYITGAILRHLLSGRGKPSLVVMTVQKEVAQRVTARPGEMSLLAVSVQFYGEPRYVGEIKAGAFWPRPEVDSAILRIDLFDEPRLPLAEEERFFRLVKTSFAQKRKQLQKNLRSLGLPRARINAALASAGIDGRRRAETLSLDEWLALYRELF
ncbi:MAG: 16S rRNA (adenine(1518)-N(6)/adenine(1519)-N(6))-dimethyltransferase RsmA [Anaerolineae bacterium]|nr:16S rRNA (adenine(1518)-N(6)/adenine(1519)-N(6))-dimethyltransferase RsmA [Anaerolineae bacterium]